MKIEALLLDLDGTLIDSTRDIAESVRHIQNHFGVALSSDKDVASYIGDGIGMLVSRALPAFSPEQHTVAVELLKRYYTQHCLEHTLIYPGVVETLRTLNPIKMAVVTNKPERVSRRILKGLKLDEYISVVVGGDTLPEKKPNPAPLHHALLQLGHQNLESTLMVGDSNVDVEAGRAAGLKTVGILSTIGDQSALRASGPDYLLTSFSELTHL